MLSTVSPNQTLERIELMICTPHQPVRIVSAKLSGRINALQILFPDSPKTFIYNGMQLIESETFSSYGISDGESIIALPKHDDKNFESWKKLTSERAEFNDLVRSMTSPSTTNEAARLRDLRLIKMESKSHLYLKLKRAFEQEDFQYEVFSAGEKSENSPNISSKAENELILDSNLMAPSEEALPVLW